jgi:hypothetical protein
MGSPEYGDRRNVETIGNKTGVVAGRSELFRIRDCVPFSCSEPYRTDISGVTKLPQVKGKPLLECLFLR